MMATKALNPKANLGTDDTTPEATPTKVARQQPTPTLLQRLKAIFAAGPGDAG